MSWLCELRGPTFGFATHEFSMVGGYTEELEKPQNCQNCGWALAGGDTVDLGMACQKYASEDTKPHPCILF